MGDDQLMSVLPGIRGSGEQVEGLAGQRGALLPLVVGGVGEEAKVVVR